MKKAFIFLFSALVLFFSFSLVKADGIPSLTAGTGGIPRTDVVDVSSWQGNISVNDYQTMKNYGVKGVIVKISEGTDYRNPYAATQINNARAAGLNVGAYHYATFGSEDSARNEANYFADTASSLGISSSGIMVDDLEDNSARSGNVQNNAMAFANQLKARGYSRPILYTGPSFASETGLDLGAFGNQNIWMAQYPYSPSSSNLWNTQYGMWQYNSDTHFPGVSGGFDVSIDYKGIMTGGDYVTSSSSVLKFALVNQASRNDGIYQAQPWNVPGNNFLANASNFNATPAIITSETKTSNSNNVTWAGWLGADGLAYYMDENGFSNITNLSEVNLNAYFSNGQTGRSDGLYLNSPWGFLGYSYANSVLSSGQDGLYINIKYQVTYNGVTWYAGYISNKLYWFDSRAVSIDNTAPTAVDYSATIIQSNRNDGLFLDKPWEFGANFLTPAKILNNQDIEVTSEWTTADGVKWAGFNYNGKTVYVDTRALIKRADAQNNLSQSVIIDQTQRNDGLYTNSPWNFAGNSYSQPAANFNGQTVTVTRQITGGNGVTWDQVNLNGQNYWIDARGTVSASAIKAADYTATIGKATSNDAVFQNVPWNYNHNGAIASLSSLTGQDVEVTSEWTTADGVKWAGFNYNGKTVYVDASKLNKISDAQNNLSQSVIIDQSQRNDGLYTNSPWNFAGNSYSQPAANFNGQTVTVTRQITGGNGVTWDQVNLNGQNYWIDARGTK